MNRKLTLLAGTHLAAIAVGVLLARPTSQPAAAKETGPVADRPARLSAADRPAGNFTPRAQRPHSQWRGSEYARAWKALRSAKLTTAERLRLQQELLKEWAEIDLVAAIETALEESWDRDGAGYYDPTGPLLGVLADALAKDPAASWDMIRGRQFGVATGMVRHVWLEAVGKADPLFLAERLGELSWRDRDKALAACQAGVLNRGDEGLSEAMFELLSKLPPEVVSAEKLGSFMTDRMSQVDTATLIAEMNLLAGENERMAKVMAIQLGTRLSNATAEEVRAVMDTLPDGIREEAIWAALRRGNPALDKLEVARMLVEEGAWSKIDQGQMIQRIQMIARAADSEAVAEWAAELPVRPETTELFHRSVDTYLRDNMDLSREWLGSLPSGEWRDRAYAEYSQQALNAHNNAEASRWALDQIGNTAFKREAEGWRSQWEQRTGWKPK